MADIHRIGLALVAAMLACVSQASWYWPFGSDDESEPPRLSELMQPASELITDAADLAADGKSREAIDKYREALARLDQIERENPDRAKKPEFATLRNKRAYVSAAIDSMLLGQVKSNAKPVAVSDTTELEKKLAEEKVARDKAKDQGPREKAEAKDEGPRAEAKGQGPREKAKAKGEDQGPREKVVSPRSRRERAMTDIVRGDFAAAKLVIDEMLEERPNSPAALNLKAVMEIRQGKLPEAELTLDRCIVSNPKSYFAYYNMCELMLKKGNRTGAKRYYETGRAYGGPKNVQLEALLK